MEPELDAVAGLLSPSTGIIDSHAYMLSLQGEAESHGCQIAFNTRAEAWEPLEGGIDPESDHNPDNWVEVVD